MKILPQSKNRQFKVQFNRQLNGNLFQLATVIYFRLSDKLVRDYSYLTSTDQGEEALKNVEVRKGGLEKVKLEKQIFQIEAKIFQMVIWDISLKNKLKTNQFSYICNFASHL